MPCFTTGTPPADKTNAAVVDTLNRFKPLPPVPHESMTLEERGTGLALVNKALENPRISSAVSPFSENAMRSSAICSSGRLLSRIALRHCSASLAWRDSPSLSLSTYFEIIGDASYLQKRAGGPVAPMAAPIYEVSNASEAYTNDNKYGTAFVRQKRT